MLRKLEKTTFIVHVNIRMYSSFRIEAGLKRASYMSIKQQAPCSQNFDAEKLIRIRITVFEMTST